MLASWDELPKSPGHVFYDRLQAVLVEAGFDAFRGAVPAKDFESFNALETEQGRERSRGFRG
jgi:hypothetical protein